MVATAALCVDDNYYDKYADLLSEESQQFIGTFRPEVTRCMHLSLVILMLKN